MTLAREELHPPVLASYWERSLFVNAHFFRIPAVAGYLEAGRRKLVFDGKEKFNKGKKKYLGHIA